MNTAPTGLGEGRRWRIPRALPWADGFCPFGAQGGRQHSFAFVPLFACPDPPPLGCAGTPVMTENYMNFTDDACMSTFTNHQIARMHYVLERSPRRRGLPNSPGLGRLLSAAASARGR